MKLDKVDTTRLTRVPYFGFRATSSRHRSGSVLSRHSYGGSSLSLSSIGSACSSATLDSAGAKKKKSLLSADYKEAVNTKSKIEGIAVSSRVKNKKGQD